MQQVDHFREEMEIDWIIDHTSQYSHNITYPHGFGDSRKTVRVEAIFHEKVPKHCIRTVPSSAPYQDPALRALKETTYNAPGPVHLS